MTLRELLRRLAEAWDVLCQESAAALDRLLDTPISILAEGVAAFVFVLLVTTLLPTAIWFLGRKAVGWFLQPIDDPDGDSDNDWEDGPN